MDVDITIRNYRCFSDTPVRFTLTGGLQSFVGVNNSGKSCILRMFYELRTVFQQLSNQHMLWNARQPQAYTAVPLVKDPTEIFCNTNERDLVIGLELPKVTAPGLHRIQIVLTRNMMWRVELFDEIGILAGVSMANEGNNNISVSRPDYTVRMPLRPAAEIFESLSKAVYLGPFRNAVNIGGAGDYYDIEIGHPFITTWKRLKTRNITSQREATYKMTEDIRRIFGFDALDINTSDDGNDLQLMIDGKSYKQSEIGSGLIQFILVLVNVAIKRPTFILIDEPELNLHPSMQIDFLTTLASYAEHGVLFATHNLGLARAVSDKVYSVRKVGKHGREVRDFTATPALAEFLGEMGFNAYQDLGFETVLLVEGPD